MGKTKAGKLSKKENATIRLRKGLTTSEEVRKRLGNEDLGRKYYRADLEVGDNCFVDGFGFGVVKGFEEGIVYCVFEQFSPVPMGLDESSVYYAEPDEEE